MVIAYVYVATTVDGNTKLVRPFGTQQTLAELRSQEPVLREVDHVDITLGASHDKIVEQVGDINGVGQVEMANPRESEIEGNPLDGSFLVTRRSGGNWDRIMPNVRDVLARLLDVTSEEVELNDYTYRNANA